MFIRFFGLLAFFLSTITLTGCGESDTDPKKEAVLVMGTSADNPPFEFYEETLTKNQKIIGYDIDIAKAIGQKLGMEIKIQDMDFNGLIPALQAKRIDFVMAAVTPTEERLKNLDFSNDYYRAPIAILTKGGLKIHHKQDFRGLRVGAQLGTTHEHLLQEFLKEGVQFHYTALNRLGDLVQEVRAGRLDCVVMEGVPARTFVKKNPQLQVFLLPQHDLGYAIALPKNSPLKTKIDQAIETLRQEGILEKIAKKWGMD